MNKRGSVTWAGKGIYSHVVALLLSRGNWFTLCINDDFLPNLHRKKLSKDSGLCGLSC